MARHRPATEEELARLVRSFAANRKPVEVLGGGTRPVGNPVKVDEVIETGALSGVTLYEPGALTLVAKAGTPLEEVNAALAAENQHLPFEPADYAGLFGTSGQSTIGGVVASGSTGPRAIQVGGARDALIGVRFVSGEGEIIKNGGRVMKNVTGYDLVKLLAGSHGTLGILTEVSFKLLPRPHTATTVKVHGIDAAGAVAAMTAALTSPYDVSGAAYDPSMEGGTALIRIEGFENSVSYRAGKLSELVADDHPSSAQIETETDATRIREIWKAIRDASFAGGVGTLLKAVLKPSDAPGLLDELRRSHAFDYLMDRGGGLVWMNADLSGEDTLSFINDAREAAAKRGGHVNIVRAPMEVYARVEAFHPQPDPIEAISAALRQQFDPAGILNPGRMAREGAVA